MFIEIEQDTNLIVDTFHDDAPGRIELTGEQARQIATSEFGHAQFMYMEGELIESPDATSEIRLSRKRTRATLSPLEFWKAVDSLGLYDAIEAIRTDPATPRSTIFELEKASEFKRNWPTLISLAGQLGVTESQLDRVFGI